MDKLKEQVRQKIVSMLSVLDCEYYKIEAERYGDICEEAEAIGKLINDCDILDWEEGLSKE